MAKFSIDEKSPFHIEDMKKPFTRAVPSKSLLQRFKERNTKPLIRSALRTHAMIARPRELHGVDPIFLEELNQGRFHLAGRFIELDPATDTPFEFQPLSLRWETELHKFSWLKHLSAQKRADPQTDYSLFYAHHFTNGWLKESFPPDHLTWHYDILSRRLINWFTHSDTIVPAKGQKYRKKILRSFGEQLFMLAENYSTIPPNYSKLQAAYALSIGGLSIAGQESLYDKFMPRFLYEITTQIFPDGGHISRNPENLLQLIQDILQFREMLTACNKTQHKVIEDKLPRMFQALRFMRLGDGCLARFNGAAYSPLEQITTVLYHDKTRLMPAQHLPDSAYFRLAAGDSLLIADGGKAPALHASQNAHAGSASFEFSAGSYPIIVNSGAALCESAEDKQYARSTMAHSTIGLAHFSSATFSTSVLQAATNTEDSAKSPEKFDLLSGPIQAEGILSQHTNTPETPSQHTLELSHNGFASVGGVRIHRKISLEPTGLTLSCTESLSRFDTTPFPQNSVITQLHIHPANYIEVSDTQSATITLPDGQKWLFTVEGAYIELLKSTYYGDAYEPLRSYRIVLNGPANINQEVKWRLQQANADGNLATA